PREKRTKNLSRSRSDIASGATRRKRERNGAVKNAKGLGKRSNARLAQAPTLIRLGEKSMQKNDNTDTRTRVTRFTLGQTFITPGAQEAIQIAGQTEIEFLRRHMSGDWGDLSADDIAENEFSLAEGLRLLSSYQTAKGQQLWIITEADRSATTILLPSEY